MAARSWVEALRVDVAEVGNRRAGSARRPTHTGREKLSANPSANESLTCARSHSPARSERSPSRSPRAPRGRAHLGRQVEPDPGGHVERRAGREGLPCQRAARCDAGFEREGRSNSTCPDVMLSVWGLNSALANVTPIAGALPSVKLAASVNQESGRVECSRMAIWNDSTGLWRGRSSGTVRRRSRCPRPGGPDRSMPSVPVPLTDDEAAVNVAVALPESATDCAPFAKAKVKAAFGHAHLECRQC